MEFYMPLDSCYEEILTNVSVRLLSTRKGNLRIWTDTAAYISGKKCNSERPLVELFYLLDFIYNIYN